MSKTEPEIWKHGIDPQLPEGWGAVNGGNKGRGSVKEHA